MSKFPFDQDESNALVGEEIQIHIYRKEYDKKDREKKEEDMGGSYNRPDIDNEYEDELWEKDLPFLTTPLKLSGESQAGETGLLRYLLKLVKFEDPNYREVQDQFKQTQDEITEFRDKKEKCLFACRVYILNTSNLTLEDTIIEEGFVWIKRWQNDREWNDEKENYFKIMSGEINQIYPLVVIYPETFFLTR